MSKRGGRNGRMWSELVGHIGALLMAETKNKDAPRQGVSTGPNARPLNDTISQTGPGVPDDTAKPVEVEPDEVRAIEQKIRSL